MKQSLLSLLHALRDLAHRHHRRWVWGLGVAASLATATAFGLAPLAPDAALLPQQTVVEALPPSADLTAQVEALADHRLELYRSELLRRHDTPERLLSRLGIDDPSAVQFLRQDPQAKRWFDGRAGKMVRATATAQGDLLELTVRQPAPSTEQAHSHFLRSTMRRSADGRWQLSHDIAALQMGMRLGSGTIRSSLFAATDEADVPDSVAVQMADIFSGDIDFHRELRKGDTFSVVYEAPSADGEPIAWNEGAGRILAVEFVNDGKLHQAVWFNSEGRGAYYDLAGKSKRRPFLASPMPFSRVTSGFAMRFHPVSGERKAHTGVDYGAPVGTPIRSVSEGVVEAAGWQNGYGKTVVVRHSPDKTTLYAHLSRIDVRAGERVLQGQHLGAVGATGVATGPHLHFEFRINGRHVDPQKATRTVPALPLTDMARAQFRQAVEQLRVPLAAAGTVNGNTHAVN